MALVPLLAGGTHWSWTVPVAVEEAVRLAGAVGAIAAAGVTGPDWALGLVPA
jgi:hypothetical protein